MNLKYVKFYVGIRSLRYCNKETVPLFKIAALGFLKRFPSNCKDLNQNETDRS